MLTKTRTKILNSIREKGYWGTPGETGTYALAIVRCAKKGYALVTICHPYGGSPHFAIPEGTGKWHTQGLNVQQAQKHLPSYGESLKGLIDSLTY